jgi:hypothetical protein
VLLFPAVAPTVSGLADPFRFAFDRAVLAAVRVRPFKFGTVVVLGAGEKENVPPPPPLEVVIDVLPYSLCPTAFPADTLTSYVVDDDKPVMLADLVFVSKTPPASQVLLEDVLYSTQ